MGDLTQASLIVVGRQDSVVGYGDGMNLLGRYPGASLAVIDGAGHALRHEALELVGALVRQWFEPAEAAG
ncbi:hypothetical protein [Microbacterium istanbulense]|uniref:Alpha/beta hydrolase n=1 Tax=Microbacterium istanbulense TaxID=3122049 RepID=A0ABU8LL00_9MICO